MAEDQGDKTEAATPRRRQEARDEGNIARSPDLTAAVLLVGILLLLVVPRSFDLGDGAVFGVGLGVTAYTLGLRHAFDADHIAAIDNTTRKLMGDGQRPLGVGFFFSLGHSTVVLVLAIAVAFAASAVASRIPEMKEIGSLIGVTVSGSFLLLIGVLNLVVLLGIDYFQRVGMLP